MAIMPNKILKGDFYEKNKIFIVSRADVRI